MSNDKNYYGLLEKYTLGFPEPWPVWSADFVWPEHCNAVDEQCLPCDSEKTVTSTLSDHENFEHHELCYAAEIGWVCISCDIAFPNDMANELQYVHLKISDLLKYWETSGLISFSNNAEAEAVAEKTELACQTERCSSEIFIKETVLTILQDLL